jgi:hypothetical protein
MDGWWLSLPADGTDWQFNAHVGCADLRIERA